eukprot:c52391_g1_i1.p1 GENE.c52391_g1_i1~~c52391_g1_i1.p1  ORF type:complete len:268 (+),score=62.96 c52391_g1_i1:44-847(+)
MMDLGDVDSKFGLHGYKKYIPTIARFLLVATFFEDGIRMFLDWTLQVDYLGSRLTTIGAKIFLILSATMQLTGGALVVTSRRHLEPAVFCLLANIILQACVYGIFTDIVLMLRNFALVGGLLMLLSEKRLAEGKRALLHAPIAMHDKSTRYLQLAGRTLLVLLLVAHMPFQSTAFTLVNVLLVLASAALLVMVVLGLKTQLAAMLLVVVVCGANILWNNFWMLDYHHHERDFFQYYFFQTLSIVGGLLLVVSVGPGDLSVDARKKRF